VKCSCIVFCDDDDDDDDADDDDDGNDDVSVVSVMWLDVVVISVSLVSL